MKTISITLTLAWMLTSYACPGLQHASAESIPPAESQSSGQERQPIARRPAENPTPSAGTPGASSTHPFWEGPSTFIHERWVYAAGEASGQTNGELAVKAAMEKAHDEFLRSTGIPATEAASLLLETAMTRHTQSPIDGTWSAFVLIRTDLARILKKHKTFAAESRDRLLEIDNLLMANSRISGDIAAKQRELESLSARYRQYTQDLAAMKADLERKKTELDQLLVLAREEEQRRSVQAARLKANLDELQARIDEMNRLRENFIEQVADREQNVRKFIRKGMTRKQVSTLVGYPDSMEGEWWKYGRVSVKFSSPYEAGTVQNVTEDLISLTDIVEKAKARLPDEVKSPKP